MRQKVTKMGLNLSHKGTKRVKWVKLRQAHDCQHDSQTKRDIKVPIQDEKRHKRKQKQIQNKNTSLSMFRTEGIDLHDGLEPLWREIRRVRQKVARRVVHQNVQPSKLVDRRLHDAQAVLVVAHVARCGACLDAFAGQLLDGGAKGGLAAAHEHDARAMEAVLASDLKADAGAAAGDEGDLAAKDIAVEGRRHDAVMMG